jgi:hypothetical protein
MNEANKPKRRRKARSTDLHGEGEARSSRPPVPKLSRELLGLLANCARVRGRFKLREALVQAIYQGGNFSEEDVPAVKVLLGRLARFGRDLAPSIEQSRHHMIRYMDQILCGNQFLLNDPVQGKLVRNARGRDVFFLLSGWIRQLENYLDDNPELRMSVSEAMGLPPDEDDDGD